MAEVPMTELDAVNLMLASIGEYPVDTLPANGLAEASIAQTKLANINRQMQSLGWWFNRETEYPMVPDGNDEIVLPTNMLFCDTCWRSARYKVVERNRKLYDVEKHQTTFTETLYCDVIWHFPYEELPQQARWYIAIKAAVRFQAAMVGSETLHGFTKEDESEAYAALLHAETEAGDYNIADNGLTHSIVHRHFNPPR